MKKSRYEMWIDLDLKTWAQSFAKEKSLSLAELIEITLREFLNEKNFEKMNQTTLAVASLTPRQQAKIVRDIAGVDPPKNKNALADDCYWCLMNVPDIDKYFVK
jgi:hypothetical protein